MSFQVSGGCVPYPLSANQVVSASSVGAVVQHGGVPHVVGVGTVTASSVDYLLTPLGGGPVVSQTVALTPIPCGLPGIEDGVSLGWLVGGVWIAVYAIVFIARMLRGEDRESSYGHG